MTLNRTRSILAIATMALPVILGASLVYVRPGGVWLWVVAMSFLPASWFGIKATRKVLEKTTVDAVIVSSLVIALPLGAKLADALGLIDESLAHVIATRWTNVLAGSYFIFHGNRLPKILTPLSDLRSDPAVIHTSRLHTGQAFVLAGFAFIVLWLVLPVNLAESIGIAVVAAGILVPSFHMRFLVSRRVEDPDR